MNECSQNATICGDQDCVNLEGTYRCEEKCLQGFIKDKNGYCIGIKHELEPMSIHTIDFLSTFSCLTYLFPSLSSCLSSFLTSLPFLPFLLPSFPFLSFLLPPFLSIPSHPFHSFLYLPFILPFFLSFFLPFLFFPSFASLPFLSFSSIFSFFRFPSFPFLSFLSIFSFFRLPSFPFFLIHIFLSSPPFFPFFSLPFFLPFLISFLPFHFPLLYFIRRRRVFRKSSKMSTPV